MTFPPASERHPCRTPGPRPGSDPGRSPGRSRTGDRLLCAATGTDLSAGRDRAPALGPGRGPRGACRRKPRPSQAHARDDRRPRTLAALGGALTDAFHGLARGSALEAAGELRVLNVAAVLLERLLVIRLERDHEIAHAGDADAVRAEDFGRGTAPFLPNAPGPAPDADDSPP